MPTLHRGWVFPVFSNEYIDRMDNRIIIGGLLLLLALAACTAPREHYVLNEKELVPEGIAYAPQARAFFITSIVQAKIIRVDEVTGEQTNFIDNGEFGYLPGVGIYVDETADKLYAIGGNDSLSAMFVFSLSTGTMENRYSANDGRYHFLNDLTMDADKNIYITDSNGSDVWWLPHHGDSLQLFYRSDAIHFPNGIACSDDNRFLYVASFDHGVRVLDLKTKELINATDSAGKGIDGLEYYRGNLYGVQNGNPDRHHYFLQLQLTPSRDRISSEKILDHYPPHNLPLTFAVAGSNAVIITHSNLQHVEQKTMTIPHPDSLKNTVLKIVNLH